VIDPDINDSDAFLAHAERPQQRGDPRGEFILLCYRGEQQSHSDGAEARDRYLQAWGKQLLGNLYEPFQRGEIELNWRLGFVDRLKIKAGPNAQAILDSLPAEPCCRYLRYLDLSHSGITALSDELGKLRQLRELDLRACPLERAEIKQPWQHLNRVWASETSLLEVWASVEQQSRWNVGGPVWLLALAYQTAVEDLGGDQLRVVLDSVERDEERYLMDLNDWSPALGAAMAREDDLDLSYRHWLVFALLRVYYNEYQIAPANRVLTKVLGRSLGKEWGKNDSQFYELFPNGPYGPAGQANRYAGLPKPGCEL